MTKYSWRPLSIKLRHMTEAEVEQLLSEEIEQHKRPAIAQRLHQRYCTLRAQRERADIMGMLK